MSPTARNTFCSCRAAAVLYQHDAVKVRVGEFVEKPRFLARIFFVVAKKVQFLKQTVSINVMQWRSGLARWSWSYEEVERNPAGLPIHWVWHRVKPPLLHLSYIEPVITTTATAYCSLLAHSTQCTARVSLEQNAIPAISAKTVECIFCHRMISTLELQGLATTWGKHQYAYGKKVLNKAGAKARGRPLHLISEN